MSDSCSHPCTVIDVVVDAMAEAGIDIWVKVLSIGVVIDTLTEVSTNALDASIVDSADMLDGGILIVIVTMASGLAMYSRDVLAGTCAGDVTKPIGVRMDAEVANGCVIFGIDVDALADVDVSLLSVVMDAWGFLAVSALLK